MKSKTSNNLHNKYSAIQNHRLIAASCLLMVSLFGCTSTPLNAKFYLLDTTPNLQVLATSVESKSQKSVSLKTVELAEFLRQAGLVIQQGEHQLHISTIHLWGEELREAIPKALVNDMRSLSPQTSFEIKPKKWQQEDYRLHIRFDHFHPNDQAKVISSGRYWIVDTKTDQQIVANNFYFSGELTMDGFIHAVQQLRLLLKRLAKEITTVLEN